ncbi:GNAT family N-acetyltransferase [Alkalihalobacillus pseudalcaliphilus]|uniref:GNAT family N-acetyltransferase n=1 Tax=Alkalihalobacillus pseudalcaliphilus TaxID=79884 RepID=UPI00064DF69D|nr:GNAT family N-acetyltransferase [Alkalihalobacillus pseudalcaliphilus]KMK76242.1 GCN5 family acetyltransferase [Alkalihalobacillus pseudalcaliphilus]
MEFRELTQNDKQLFASMDTGIDDDYVLHIYDYLVQGENRLFGLFVENKLVSLGGFSIFANEYAMLGRLRSDRSIRGKNYATTLMKQIIEEAFTSLNIQWVGGNTQEENIPARRVLKKIGLEEGFKLYNATTTDISFLQNGANVWKEVSLLQEKKKWLEQSYLKEQLIFPYECYYPFPASEALFTEEDLQAWSFFENEDQSKFVILKNDRKGYQYVHVLYPYDNVFSEPGLWETVDYYYARQLQEQENETRVWVDLTEEQVAQLVPEHTFEWPSPWILHGKRR